MNHQTLEKHLLQFHARKSKPPKEKFKPEEKPPMAKALDHIHIFVKWKKFMGEMVYKCDHPQCWFTAPKSKIIGKRTICGVCRETEFTLTKDDLKRVRPRCINCSQSKDAIEKRAVKDRLTEVFDSIFEQPTIEHQSILDQKEPSHEM